MDDQLTEREARWQEETAFFDHCAEEAVANVAPLDPLILKRYLRAPLRRKFSQEFRFSVLGDFREKTFLDVGCGDGRNAVLLAKLGARVVGIDISPAAVELARKRARINGVQDATSFVCSPLEVVQFEPNSFDIIWGDAILHHLIPVLEMILGRLVYWAKPGATMLFAEPINLSPALRRLRQSLPIHTRATPGERPLEAREIDLIRRFVPNLVLRPFALLGRLDRFFISDRSFERASELRRQICSFLTSIDYGLLCLPGFRNLGGQAVMYGHPKK